ncbi:substrate-binding domain-containing protein [Sphingomonas piscis]|uniref:Substrate-binding domain-containing protein n=2 Tax=Sphingomonas piscis TaxID=2714943 RepID=A0A6G7YT54_9SPHN|nr:substrate-binding domain-containing protein [Sphingomonas piscis]
MTVSRVINGGKNVREATRVKVTEAVKQLNYAPNSAARSLAAGEPMHFGLLYANPSASYLSQFLIGALHAARHAGAHLTIEACESEDAGEQAEVARRFALSDVDGVILPPPLSESKPILQELANLRMPFVTVAMASPKPHSLNVRIDDRAAAEEITRYLLCLGHRNIGFIRGHPNHIASQDRAQGFADALKEAGMKVDDMAVEQGYFSYRSGIIATERLLKRAKRPTAIFASNDDMAAAAISVIHRHGMSVPQDISVVGFDDTMLATSVWPELTTVKQPIAAMAEAALDLLMADLRSRITKTQRKVNERVLTHALIIRESSGPPPLEKGSKRREKAASK